MSVTREGKVAFGEWVAKTRLSPEIRAQVVEWLKSTNPSEYVGDIVTQGQFARWVTAQSGFRVSDSAIGRLERGISSSAPPVEVLAALTMRMKILRFPDGHYCTLEEAIAVLTGELDPVTGKRPKSKNGTLS
jgi:hypothetical protein